MNYNKGKHIEWWQTLSAPERFRFMNKHDFKHVTGKLIYTVWKWELMNKISNNYKTATDIHTLLCAICGSNKNIEFVKITNCNLCKKCNKKLADSFEYAMRMDRSDYPEL